MAAAIQITPMERGAKWSALTGDLTGEGPSDKTLHIRLNGGSFSDIPGFNGITLDIAELRAESFGAFVKSDWIPQMGSYPCRIGQGYIEVTF